MPTLQFLGATGTVTGSKFLVEHQGFKLLVDCGLFQGLKELRELNWSRPPFDPKTLGLVAITHAHLDHSGYLPVLYKQGYAAHTLVTASTRDLLGILLPDSGHLQEEDARFANKRGSSRHKPALPLYTEDEGRRVLSELRTIELEEPREVGPGVTVRFLAAGHILGAAMIEVKLASKDGKTTTVLFTGDLGRPHQPLLPDPTPLTPCDHLLLESTYGNRDHPKEDAEAHLAAIVNTTIRRGGTLLIPAFAVGRTQHVMYLLHRLRLAGTIPTDIPIFVDSPMAIEASRIVMSHLPDGGNAFGMGDVRLATTPEESKALNNLAFPAIIVSASGMAEGGRILHHLAHRLSDHRSTVLFVGYQAVGTRGRALQDGKSVLRMYGREVVVRARIETLDGLSAHADRGEILAWLAAGKTRPKCVHVVHGEPEAREALAELIRDKLHLDVRCPDYLSVAEL